MLPSIPSFWSSLSSYAEMRPDFRLRTELNRRLKAQRSRLSAEVWFEKFWLPRSVPRSLSTFVYQSLGELSGLDWGRVLPGDRLQADLQLPLVCWFDWELDFCETLAQAVGVRLESPVLLDEVDTVEDLLTLLHQQMLQTA